MVRHKYIDWICTSAAGFAVLLPLLRKLGEKLGIPQASSHPGNVTRVVDDSRGHPSDIQIAGCGAFIGNGEKEE